MQNLTEETVQKSSKKRHDMPTQQQKRKHQITYLAFQVSQVSLVLHNHLTQIINSYQPKQFYFNHAKYNCSS